MADSETDASNSERIVGFFGRSYWGENFSGLIEFGIITAPRDAVLPDVVYDMPELQNIDGGVTVSLPFLDQKSLDILIYILLFIFVFITLHFYDISLPVRLVTRLLNRRHSQ